MNFPRFCFILYKKQGGNIMKHSMVIEYENYYAKPFRNLTYLKQQYGDLFDAESNKCYDNLLKRKDAFYKNLESILDKDWIIVSSNWNKNNKLVRTYISNQTLKGAKDCYYSLNSFPAETSDVSFVEIPLKELSKITLDNIFSRYLSGRFERVIDIISNEKGTSEANKQKEIFIIGTDVKELKEKLRFDGNTPIYDFLKYDAISKAAVTIEKKQTSIFKEKLFDYYSSGFISYEEAVEKNCVMIINTRSAYYDRDLNQFNIKSNYTSIATVFNKLYEKLGIEAFNRKFVYISYGNYKRLHKHLKNYKELPLWSEVIKDNLTEKDFATFCELINNVSIKDASDSLFSHKASSTAIDYYIKKVEEKTPLTKKQQAFLQDLETCIKINNSGLDYAIDRCANFLSKILGYKNYSAYGTEIDLHLIEKYPFIKIISRYDICDVESAKMLLDIIETYPTTYNFEKQ